MASTTTHLISPHNQPWGVAGGNNTKGDFLETVVNSLAVLAREEWYGPLDFLASTRDIQLIQKELYAIVRELASRGLPTPSPSDIELLLALGKKDPGIFTEVALKALVRGVAGKATKELNKQATASQG